MAVETQTEPFLKTGEEYRESLRDGRRIIAADASEIEDVTKYPPLSAGIDLLAELYDAQFAPETRDVTTFVDEETGNRASLAWQVPRSVEDLRRRRELCRLSTYHTLGVFGRPPDYGSFNALGLLSVIDKIEGANPEWAENVREFNRWGRSLNLISADIVADVQSDRSIPVAQKPGRLRAVEERPDGLVLYGGKPCASVAAQGHIGTIVTLLSPGADPDAAIFAAVPVNSPGISIVLREPIASLGDPDTHPLDARGEEADGLMIFDHVFVPKHFVFSYQKLEMLELYHELGALALWHILARLSYRAQIFAGTAQVIAEVLGTTKIPQVRDAVADVDAYAKTLMAFTIASEESAALRNDVMIPDDGFVTAGRLHSVVHYPRVMQLLRDISGQGLISRFTRQQFDHEEIGQLLDEFLPGTGVSARGKNRLFNFVWDMTSSSHAMRVALFENVNATPPAAMRNHLYEASERPQWAQFVRRFAGVE
jgi:4-hydroxyphenylacetate 3-monooxygenase